ncbi:MAG: hypothetical protein ORN50_07345 [Crocinitomicaceae bacterium]|nr:hypothetical protein [Crocinitomicaceae bacterium]
MKEWRNGQLIGYITRDMELLVIQSLNLPPTSNALITILPQVNNTNWVQCTQTPTINLSTVENLTIEFHAVIHQILTALGFSIMDLLFKILLRITIKVVQLIGMMDGSFGIQL